MAVENKTILNKMMNELEKAKQNQQDPSKFKQHIANIKLLCDLFIDEEDLVEEKDIHTNKVTPKNEEFSEAELKAMIGNQDVIQKVQQQQFKKTVTIDHEDANGNSIFDF